ncbi:hypothetical protein DIZ76_015494 [Coccidioides immitis]|nr:hypothetical protein DIZ76_015494 [Coccidioides immitis]
MVSKVVVVRLPQHDGVYYASQVEDVNLHSRAIIVGCRDIRVRWENTGLSEIYHLERQQIVREQKIPKGNIVYQHFADMVEMVDSADCRQDPRCLDGFVDLFLFRDISLEIALLVANKEDSLVEDIHALCDSIALAPDPLVHLFLSLKRLPIAFVVVFSTSAFLLVEECEIQDLGRLERVRAALVHEGLGTAAEMMFIAVA